MSHSAVTMRFSPQSHAAFILIFFTSLFLRVSFCKDFGKVAGIYHQLLGFVLRQDP